MTGFDVNQKPFLDYNNRGQVFTFDSFVKCKDLTPRPFDSFVKCKDLTPRRPRLLTGDYLAEDTSCAYEPVLQS